MFAMRDGGKDPSRDFSMPTIETNGLHPAVVELIDQRRQAVEESRGSANSWGNLATVLDLHDLKNSAVTCYLHAIELDETNFRWPYFAGICASIGNREQALDFFAQAHQIESDYPPLLARVGILLLQGGETATARASFEQTVALDDSLIQAHLGLARCAMVAGDLDLAGQHLDRCEALQPTGSEVASLRAQWWGRRGEAERARSTLDAVEGKAPREPLPDRLRSQATMSLGVGPGWWKERSRRLIDAGQPEKAMEMWEPILAQEPENAQFQFQMAQAAQAMNDKQKAITHYLEATKLDPEMTEAFFQFGTFLFNMGNEGAAEKALRRAYELDPDSADICTTLGALLMNTKQQQEGLSLLESAARIRSGDANIRFNLGVALKAMDQKERARDELLIAVGIDPSLLRARFELGLVLKDLNQFDESAEQFAIIVEVDSVRVSAWMNLVRAYNGNRRHGDALAALRSARVHLPRNAPIAAELAWLLATGPDQQLRNGAEAQEIAVKLCAGSGATMFRSFDIWAASLAEIENFDGAIEKAKHALVLFDQNPGDPQLRQELEDRLQLYLQNKPYRSPVHPQ